MSFDIFNRLKKSEDSFLESEFFCPVLKGQQVRVHIDGVAYLGTK